MASKDDEFGSDGRTVLPSRRADRSPPATIIDPASAAPAGWSSGTVVEVARPVPSPDGRHDLPETVLDAFSGLTYTSSDPLIAAAAPLLMLLGDLQLVAAEPSMDALAGHVTSALREFERRAAEGGVAAEDIRIAKYALCETADDILGNLPGIDRKAWLADGMLARFFQSGAAGTGFFEALNAALAKPEAHAGLLKLMHACLSLGYQGQYRGRRNGQEGLQRVRRDVYETIRYFEDRPGDEISPAWQPLSVTAAPARRRVPPWAVAAAVPALAAAMFFAMRIHLTDQADAVAADLLALTPSEAVAIRHAAFVPLIEASPVEPPPPATPSEPAGPTQLERVRQALAADIGEGNLEVGTRGDFIVIQVDNRLLFSSGKAELKAGFGSVAERIAAALRAEPGAIRVVGHTDNVKPGRSGVFKSNHDLSVARAEAVRKVLAPALGDPSRLEVLGKGDEEPIADNATAEGRARNRRVEVMLRKEETL